LPAFTPPRPTNLSAIGGLIRALWRGDGDLLSLLPNKATKVPIGNLGHSRRSIRIVNDPALTRRIFADEEGIFPKNDLMVGALEPLIGGSIFVSHGERWRRDRRMIDPAFTHMRVGEAFPQMNAAIDAAMERLGEAADRGERLSLDLAMSRLTADVICRTVFSVSLEAEMAQGVFEDFAIFERSAAQVEILRLIAAPAFAPIRQHPHVLAACARIRERLGALVDTHLGENEGRHDDIAAAVIAARDEATGARFTRDELIDQLGVMFLAGHETTASGLTWAFFIIARHDETRRRMREEIARVCGDGPIGLEAVKRLTFCRNVFRETLRLYPPITFIPRVALKPTELGGCPIKRGAMLMIAPWAIHRHERHWSAPDAFDPDRFASGREEAIPPGAYIPFGQGPRICVGAAFATVEATLILARLVRAFDVEIEAPERVRPVARLTTRPAEEIRVRVRRR
jgi:cytochrome P450